MDNQDTFIGSDKNLLDSIYAFKKMREPYEPYSYLARRAYEGKHFTYWNKNAQKLTEHPTKKVFFNQLPEVAKQTDAFENFLISTDFVFTVIPAMLSQDKDVDTSMYLSMLAHYYYVKLRSMTTFADFVHFALLDNVSFIEVTPNDQKDDVTYRTWDMFDILFNPAIRDWNDQTLVVKVVKRRIPDLKASKLYKVPANYVGVNTSFNSWKDVYMAEKYTSFATMAKDETLLFECYILDPQKGLTIRTLDGAANVLRDDNYPNIKRCPIRPLRIYSGEWYQPSYTYRLIPMNRSLDTVANRLEDLVLRLAKGGWIVQEDESIDGGMNEETGQMIKYQTQKPEQIQMPPIPNFLMEWFSSMISLSERYGLSSVFSGGLPAKSSGLRAGKMIDQLTGLTQQNNTVTINNLRGTIREILEFTFQFLYEMWQTPQQDIYTNVTENIPQFISQKAIGLYKDDGSAGNMVAIPSEFKRFDVDIDDGMGYTLEQRKETALTLNKTLDEFGKPIVSGATLRKLFKLGSSGYIMEAENTSIVDTPEFQELIQLAQSGKLNPQQAQAVSTTLQIIGTMTQSGQESGATTSPQQVGLATPTPTAPTTGQPTPPPGKPMGQSNGAPSPASAPASGMPPRVG